MVDGAKPQPPQRFKPADFLEWARKQKALAKEVISCYEAGPTGFWLHRQLTALGVRNYVVCPTRLDERYQGVANDRTDALELATRLDRYVAGNDRALAVVRVPTEAVMDGRRVFVFLPEEGRLATRNIRIGLSNWDWSEVLEGVSPDEWVVVNVDNPDLEDGAAAVRLEEAP
jgi:hypothetical protein